MTYPQNPAESSPQEASYDSRYGLGDLLECLDLEVVGSNHFRGKNLWPTGRRVLYGGHVAAQALRAAGMTVPVGRNVHSLHGYFLRAGIIDQPTDLKVVEYRDGRTYSARQVMAMQGDDVIFSLTCSFATPEDGIYYNATPMPPTPKPHELPGAEAFASLGPAMGIYEFAQVGTTYKMDYSEFWSCPTQFWARTKEEMPDDPILHACLLAYASDLGTGFGDLRLPIDPPGGGPSLDHAMWFHIPIRADEWFLVDQVPMMMGSSRGLYRAAIYNEAGNCCVSLTQELLTRNAPI